MQHLTPAPEILVIDCRVVDRCDSGATGRIIVCVRLRSIGARCGREFARNRLGRANWRAVSARTARSGTIHFKDFAFVACASGGDIELAKRHAGALQYDDAFGGRALAPVYGLDVSGCDPRALLFIVEFRKQESHRSRTLGIVDEHGEPRASRIFRPHVDPDDRCASAIVNVEAIVAHQEANAFADGKPHADRDTHWTDRSDLNIFSR
jgi:hypothetical protein